MSGDCISWMAFRKRVMNVAWGVGGFRMEECTEVGEGGAEVEVASVCDA